MFDESHQNIPNAWFMRETSAQRIKHFTFEQWKAERWERLTLCHPRFKWWQLALDRFPRNPGETKVRSGNKGAHMNRCRFTSIPTYFLRFASCQMITGKISWHIEQLDVIR